MAIGDFATREEAEEVFQRITGIPYATHAAEGRTRREQWPKTEVPSWRT